VRGPDTAHALSPALAGIAPSAGAVPCLHACFTLFALLDLRRRSLCARASPSSRRRCRALKSWYREAARAWACGARLLLSVAIPVLCVSPIARHAAPRSSAGARRARGGAGRAVRAEPGPALLRTVARRTALHPAGRAT